MRQRCGMRLPGATGKAAPGAERGQRIRELTARGQCCGAAVRRQRGGFLILCSCATRHGVFLPVAELLENFEAASSARVDRSPMEPGVSRGRSVDGGDTCTCLMRTPPRDVSCSKF